MASEPRVIAILPSSWHIRIGEGADIRVLKTVAFRRTPRKGITFELRADVVSVISSESRMVCVFGNFPQTRFLAHTGLQQISPAEATL